MADFTIKTNADDVQRKLERLNNEIKFSMPALWSQLGPRLVDDVRERITSEDQGRWAAVSKWVRAKKNVLRALQGTEQYVKWKIQGDKMIVYGDMPGDWTFTQHHEGFENKQNNVNRWGGITIDVVNPGPLGLSKPGPFSWMPGLEEHHTPARKIWPSDKDARDIVLPLASRWLESVVNRVEQA